MEKPENLQHIDITAMDGIFKISLQQRLKS